MWFYWLYILLLTDNDNVNIQVSMRYYTKETVWAHYVQYAQKTRSHEIGYLCIKTQHLILSLIISLSIKKI